MHTIKVGIDRCAFYTPPFYLDLATLAEARGVDKDKFYIGLGQHKMSVIPPDEGIVTMGASAALQALKDTDLNDIDWLLFATESGIDHSKAAGIYVHTLLGLNPSCRVLELKQACYSATGAIQLLIPYLQANPSRKALLIAADIARYGLNTSGESSQGGGAVAMVLSSNPRMLSFETGSGVHTEDIMDFWRHYHSEALVEGKYSCEMYLKVLEACWNKYSAKTGRTFQDHGRFLYHIPVPRLAEKAHIRLAKINEAQVDAAQVQHALMYSRLVGNCYTASLYLGLISLLENDPDNLSHQRIGFYSYGSGCVGEFFSGVVEPTYRSVLERAHHHTLLSNRTELSQSEYEEFYRFQYPTDGSRLVIPHYTDASFRLSHIDQHKCTYEKVDS
ncbi:MAG: hydroxymethylglutaryl-CoA synthase [Gammaproteobacteria bacterium]|nr:hydroxymethylglutaryl-CoA synthase [Gammaproteobacteria bacterium]